MHFVRSARLHTKHLAPADSYRSSVQYAIIVCSTPNDLCGNTRFLRSARFRRLLRAAAQEQGDEQEYNAEHSRQAAVDVAQRLRAERFMQDCAHEQGCERQYDGANAERAPSV